MPDPAPKCNCGCKLCPFCHHHNEFASPDEPDPAPVPAKCPHDVTDGDMAWQDGLCGYCLRAEVAALREQNARWSQGYTQAVKERQAALARVEALEVALIAHREDLHEHSDRPCPTCTQSAKVLGIALTRCQRIGERCVALKEGKI